MAQSRRFLLDVSHYIEKQVIEFAVYFETDMELMRFCRNLVSCYGLNLMRELKQDGKQKTDGLK